MDPNTLNTAPSFDLPKPTAEQAGNPNVAQQTRPEQASGSEAGSSELPSAGGAQPAMPSAQVAANDASATAVPSGMVPVSQPVAAPMMADDVDLIEKEWVNKAKSIVEHTKYDPREQNKEINKMKADYIKKRYNREIKVSEE